jgi:hypothetical protein
MVRPTSAPRLSLRHHPFSIPSHSIDQLDAPIPEAYTQNFFSLCDNLSVQKPPGRIARVRARTRPPDPSTLPESELARPCGPAAVRAMLNADRPRLLALSCLFEPLTTNLSETLFGDILGVL